MSRVARALAAKSAGRRVNSSSSERKPADYVPSPCISVCVMDADGVLCTGCFRTLDEIAAWGMLDADAKRRDPRRAARAQGIAAATR